MGATGYVTGPYNNILIPASKLGDATTADVLSGKTFTSINGVNIVGTYAIKIASGVASPMNTETISAADGYTYKRFMELSLGSPSGTVKTIKVVFKAMLNKYSGIVSGGSTTGGKLVVSKVDNKTPGSSYTFTMTSGTSNTITLFDYITMKIYMVGSEYRLRFDSSSGQYFVGYKAIDTAFSVDYEMT